ncbi:MAG TPA: hypothetical protein PLQ13_09700 [Candidatus Krumholzibacteria bacterium]|nr:hypothetical protein [Candidatus Krumholzibacteria bacterium]
MTRGLLIVALALAWAAPTVADTPTLQWVQSHDGGAGLNDDGFVLTVAPDGDVVVVGESADGLGGIDLAVRRLARADGHQKWHTRYEGYDDKDMGISAITWDTAGQLIVAGYVRGCVG